MRFRYAAAAALFTAAFVSTSCKGCTENSGNEPPTVVLGGVPMGAFVVGNKMHIQVDASDPEGGTVSFDWDYKPKDATWTVEDRATWLASDSYAVFEWDPLASDATNGVPIQLIFIATDDAGKTTEKVVTIDIVPGNGVPQFQSNASELYDPRIGKPLEFEVRVTDNDSSQVTLDMERATAPAGANFEQSGPYTARFSWTPTVEQLERRVHNVTFTADDATNPLVTFKVTIVIRTATAITIDNNQTDQTCPGEAAIAHTPLGPQRSAADPYRFEASLLDPRFDEVILYWTFADAYNGDFDPADESKKMTSIAMEDQGGTWVAELAPQASVINPDLGALSIYYQICAFDNDASGVDSIACTPSSGDLELYNAFTAYLPDAEDCVEDSIDLSPFPNDTPDAASAIADRWEPFRACAGGSDYHAITVRPGESALLAAVYPKGQNITFTAEDEAQAPIELKQSGCTGMVTAEVSVPEDGAQKTYYLKADGDNVNYVVKAFRSGNPSSCADAANEPNEDAASATPVMDGTMMSAEICAGNDLDVYAISLNAGDNLSVTTQFTNQNGNLDMTLYSPSQSGDISAGGTGVKFTFSFDDSETLEYTAEESGTHYLLVFNNDDSANAYTISFDVGAAPPCPDGDSYSGGGGNHTSDAAAVIDSTAGSHSYTGLEVCPGKPDWYVSTGFNLGTILGDLSVTGGDGSLADVSVKVFDPMDNLVKTGTDEGTFINFDYTPQTTGPYYLKVETTVRVVYRLDIER